MHSVRKMFARADENEERGNWGGRLDYVMVTLGVLIGLPVIWRTPYVIYQSGGLGACWIPLLFWTIVVGIPLMYLEISWGQFAGVGAISMWNISPILKGVGYSVTLMCLLGSAYTVSLIGAHIVVLVRALSKSHMEEMFSCANAWNTQSCIEYMYTPETIIGHNGMANVSEVNYGGGATRPIYEFIGSEILPPNFDGSHNPTPGMNWPLFGGMTAACIIIFLIVALGPRSVGRVAYVTTLLPLIFGFVLLMRAMPLEGASEGVKHFTFPDYSRLTMIPVWSQSLTTVLFGLGVGFSTHSTLASYNKFGDKSMGEAVLLPFLHLILSILIGVVIFSYMGFLARSNNAMISDVMHSGFMLTLGAMPDALHLLPGGRGWIVIFMLAVILLALGAQMCLTLTITTAIVDELPVKVFSRRLRHVIVTAVVCCATFLIGISCVTHSAASVIQFMDLSIYVLPKLFLIVQCGVISWLYGFSRFFEDMSLMYGTRPFWIWKPMWGVVTPLFVLLVFLDVIREPIDMFIGPAHAIGAHLLRLGLLLPIPVVAIIHVIRRKTTDMSKAFWPGSEWGPQVSAHREMFHTSCGRVPLAQFATAPYGPAPEVQEMKPEV